MLKIQGVDISMPDKKFTTLLDVIPRPLFNSIRECAMHVDEAQQYLIDREKDIATSDEVSFVIVLNRYIEYFERAKAMLARNRYTVKFHGTENGDPDIVDYEIISTSKNKEENQTGL